MAAKKKRRPGDFDFHQALGAHIDAHAKAHEWAERCLALRASGKSAQAKAAEKKAKHWLKKVLALEARAARYNPHDGRALRPSKGKF